MSTPPVLFLIFNRKETALRSLESIRRAQPSQLFIAADGPRKNHDGELENCEAVRQAVLAAVDWDCEIQTLFRPENLGCKHAVSSAIDWFFEHVESGIIIEDDCVVSDSFFRFSEELLEKYKDDTRILSISANCFQPSGSIKNDSYYFSKYQHCWGWASWRRAWELYDKELAGWPAFSDAGGLKKYSEGCSVFGRHFSRIFNDVRDGKIDTWDFQWMFTGWKNEMVSILPAVNMCTNTGCGKDSTHTSNPNEWTANLIANEIKFPLSHPETVTRNLEADRWSDVHLWHIRRFQTLIHILSSVTILRFLYHRVYMNCLMNRKARSR